MKYRAKPTIKEAVKWTGKNPLEISKFMNMKPEDIVLPAPQRLAVVTLEGVMLADPGDYIVKGIKGEFYPCKPDIFEASYEPAD